MSLSNSQYDDLMRDYDRRRQYNAELLSGRIMEVYDAVPGIRSIDEEMADAAMESFSERLKGREAAGALGERIGALKEKKQRLLTEAGYDRDYLEPVYDCPDCHDTGYIDGQKCHCLIQREMDILYGDSHLGGILDYENYDTFSLDYYSKDRVDSKGESSYRAACDALSVARALVPGDNLLLYGDAGVGKTFLSHCIAKDWLSAMRSVIYVTAFTLTEIFSRRTFEKTADAKREFDGLFSCELLIIDDLGTEFSNSFTQPIFFQCINERILRGRSTVISTNLSIPQIKDIYTERISSRLVQHYRMVHLFGDDIRIKKKISG